MSRISTLFMVVVLLSCQRPSGYKSQPTNASNTTKTNFNTYKGIRIDTNTTMTEIKQLFPTAVSGRLDVDKERKLWIIQLKEDYEGMFPC